MNPPISIAVPEWESRVVSQSDWTHPNDEFDLLERVTVYDFAGTRVRQYEVFQTGMTNFLNRTRFDIVWRIQDRQEIKAIALTLWPETWSRGVNERCIGSLTRLFSGIVGGR